MLCPYTAKGSFMVRTRADLLDDDAPEGVEVIQLTTEAVPSSHVYMEAQIFTPDSKRFVLHRSAHAHGSDKHDPEHRYLVCDIEDDCALRPITEETGATAPSVSPDGRYLYYIVDETTDDGGRITLKRVKMDGTDRRTLYAVEGEVPGTAFRPCLRVYPLSTIRSDGERLALQVGLRSPLARDVTFGLLVFDLEQPSVEIAHQGPSWFNMHPQYSRSLDAEAMHDVMIQHNHGGERDASGKITRLTGEAGADIHVIRDDGTDFRNFPCGRDGNERCHGHQCWRGRTTWAILGTGTRDPDARHLVECRPAPYVGHVGIETPGGVRNDLSRPAGFPRTAHFGVDIEGKRLVTDADPYDQGGRILLMDLGEPGVDPARNVTPLAWTRGSSVHTSKDTHPHPFLSPDGRLAFFNSNESGVLQAYMIGGLKGA